MILLQDLSLAVRHPIASAGAMLLAIFTLGPGIGANAAMFSWRDRHSGITVAKVSP
jgi:hypothetical protein